MDQIINAFKLAVQQNYVKFSGRANRAEYWYFVLGYLVIFIAIIILMAISTTIGGILYAVAALGLMLPNIGAAVRRMHDINKSGWFILIPLYNIYLLAQPGDQGANQYGEPSKNLQ